MSMHPALRLGNLDRLPTSMKARAILVPRIATEIALDRIQTYLTTATEEQAILLLPVFYTNLDPGVIPDLDQFDTENPSAHVENCIGRAMLSLYSLYSIQFPTSIGPDIWPRVFPWVQFIYTYRNHLPNIPLPEVNFCLEFLMFAGTFARHQETFSLILSTAGVRFMVAKACFISDKKIAEPINLAEIIDGAGGTLDHLAHLIVLDVEALVTASFPASAHTMDYVSILLCGILDFIILVEPAFDDPNAARDAQGALGTALASQNITSALTGVVCSLGEARTHVQATLVNHTIEDFNPLMQFNCTDTLQRCDANTTDANPCLLHGPAAENRTLALNTQAPCQITIPFFGTAVYAVMACPNDGLCQFVIDDNEPEGPIMGTQGIFALVALSYLNNALPNGQHTLIITTARKMFMDYVMYTTDDTPITAKGEPATTKNPSNTVANPPTSSIPRPLSTSASSATTKSFNGTLTRATAPISSTISSVSSSAPSTSLITSPVPAIVSGPKANTPIVKILSGALGALLLTLFLKDAQRRQHVEDRSTTFLRGGIPPVVRPAQFVQLQAQTAEIREALGIHHQPEQSSSGDTSTTRKGEQTSAAGDPSPGALPANPVMHTDSRVQLVYSRQVEDVPPGYVE
ncbi:hypothetical protein B0H19DRAFT_1063317 [Mycena capillaripes]|nr:hypothetical protein B0H19DRAFT_1063317 [Mycena capillaripes]